MLLIKYLTIIQVHYIVEAQLMRFMRDVQSPNYTSQEKFEAMDKIQTQVSRILNCLQ